MPHSVLVVDDEDLTLRTVSRGLRQEGFDVSTAASGEDALALFADEKPDLTLLDIVLPGIDGVEVLRRMKAANPAAIILMMSAYHMVDRAVEAMKLGAYDYLIKPFHLAELIATLHRAGEMLALRVRVRDDVEQARGRYDFGKVVTQNEATRRMLAMARKAAAAMPLLELNCAALPDTLLESELFGFEPGAFTDARRRKEGLIERAHSGTLFLDEIMSASVQAKLLKVLEEGTFMRLGGTRPIRVNVRLIAATNANLKEAVARGAFREDLYYRLNVVPLYLRPLRERREDIVPLALELVHHFNRELKKNFTGLTPGAAELLQNYSWPGNIRELKNVIERTMILASEGDIDDAALPEEIRDYNRSVSKDRSSKTSDADLKVSSSGRPLISLRELEDQYIQEVLVATGNNKTQAARILGIHPTSLQRRLKKEQ